MTGGWALCACSRTADLDCNRRRAVAGLAAVGGPHRNFNLTSAGLPRHGPKAARARIWSRDLGEGYSSIAAADGILYTMYRKGDRDVVVALAADSGKTVGI